MKTQRGAVRAAPVTKSAVPAEPAAARRGTASAVDECYKNDQISEPIQAQEDLSLLLLYRFDSPPSSCCGIKIQQNNDNKLLPQHPSPRGEGKGRGRSSGATVH